MTRPLFRFWPTLASPLLLASCILFPDPFAPDPLSGERFETSGVTFSGGSTIVSGTVRNAGGKTWTPYWNVRGVAYENADRKKKVGEVYQSFNFSLAPGETTGWQFEVHGHYPGLTIGKLGGFKGH